MFIKYIFNILDGVFQVIEHFIDFLFSNIMVFIINIFFIIIKCIKIKNSIVCVINIIIFTIIKIINIKNSIINIINIIIIIIKKQ